MRTPPTLRRALLVAGLLALALAPGPAHAEDEGEMGGPAMAKTMLLGPARVLASPGAPSALDAFLPGGKRPERLRWPLPDRPVVVLGLPREDDVAQQVADAFQIDTDDLGGGYRIAAWRDERRPMVIIMAADAAALAAARFEFDTSAAMEMAAPDMRSLDFKKPNQEAGVAVTTGTRLVQPRFAYRAWAPLAWDDPRRITRETVTRAAGARVNRLWFRMRDLPAGSGMPDPKTQALLARCKRHGIVPVLWLPMGDATVDSSGTNPMLRARLVASMSELALVKLGIRHVALQFQNDPRDLPRHEADRATCEARLLETLALEFGQTEEIVLIPSAEVPGGAGRPLGASDLATLRIAPDVLARMHMGWSGPHPLATSITTQAARARARAAGSPLILLDRWAEPFQDPALPYVPTVPPTLGPAHRHGREADLPEALAGSVVFGRQGTDALLESMWEPVAPRDGAALLDALAPGFPATRGAAWADALLDALRKADQANMGLVPWMAPLIRELETARRADAPVWVLPRAAVAGGADATPDEGPHLAAALRTAVATWGPSLPPGHVVGAFVQHGALTLLASRGPDAADTYEPLVRIRLRRPGSRHVLTAEWSGDGWRVEGATGSVPLTRAEGGNIATRTSKAMGRDVDLLELDRFALGGDLHTGRVFEVGMFWGPKAIWPPNGTLGSTAPWIIGPVGPEPLPPVGLPQPKGKAKTK